MNPVPAELNQLKPGRVALVGRDPGEREIEYRVDEETGVLYPDGRPFVGPAGQELERVLSELGLRRQDVNILNVVGRRPPDNDFKRHDPDDVWTGVQELDRLLKQLKPSLVIALGNEASFATIPDWPTAGRGIFGAKGIEERRGYFWESPYGWVLSTLHPAGVLRKVVPGAFLLENDFKRARKWLRGQLPRETFPEPRRLTEFAAMKLQNEKLLAWDVETKWGMDALLCSGFCGADLIPYVGVMPRDWKAIQTLLRSPVRKVGHNGMFDLAVMRKLYDLGVRGYTDDTQHLWWALEPELAGQDETGEGYEESAHRMTRKALAFLATVYGFNVPFWKFYPPPDDPDHLEKMVCLNAADVWMTRQLATTMLTEIKQEKVEAQYRRSMDLVPFAVDVHLRGMRVDDALRQERIAALGEREERLKGESHRAALAYIEKKQVAYFEESRRCDCCGGGRSAREGAGGAAWAPLRSPRRRRTTSRSISRASGFLRPLRRF